jgi:hypothetical protein
MPLSKLRHIGIEEIPGIAARIVEDDVGLEGGGVVEASDIDPDQLRHIVGLVVDRDAAVRTKAFSLRCAPVAGARDLANLTGDVERAAREDEHRTVPAARIQLTIPTLTLKGADRFCADLIADSPT